MHDRLSRAADPRQPPIHPLDPEVIEQVFGGMLDPLN
jgi:hypothetical protein